MFEILANTGVTAIAGEEIFRNGWPILLVALGASILFGGRAWFPRWRCDVSGSDSDRKGKSHGNRWHHMGDLYHGREPWVLDADLDLQHGIGDIVFDLSIATISNGIHHIQAGVSIGELLIRVPDHVNAVVDGCVDPRVGFLRRAGPASPQPDPGVDLAASPGYPRAAGAGRGLERIYHQLSRPQPFTVLRTANPRFTRWRPRE